MSSLEIALTEARSWLGTPWKHAARIKGVGCDCINYIAAIGETVDILVPVPKMYQRSPERDYILPELRSRFIEEELTPSGTWIPGRLLVFQYSGIAHHVGLVTEPDKIIHASLLAKKVIEERLSKRELIRAKWCFDLGLRY